MKKTNLITVISMTVLMAACSPIMIDGELPELKLKKLSEMNCIELEQMQFDLAEEQGKIGHKIEWFKTQQRSKGGVFSKRPSEDDIERSVAGHRSIYENRVADRERIIEGLLREKKCISLPF